VDIKPVERDAKGIPQDAVNAIADGVVAYVSLLPGASNYGRYVVVEHRWEGCSYLSLYAHLATIDVKPGEPVGIGQRLGLLGWSGDGIDLRRAHVHLELDLFLHSEFVAWHDKHFRNDGPSKNVFNGLNLAGVNVAEFFLQRQKNPNLTIAEFIQSQPVAFRVAVPGDARLELKGRYPWMLAKGGSGPSWEISFTASGLPVRIARYEAVVAVPVLTWVKPVNIPLAWATKDLVTDSGSGARLSEAGLRMLDLIAPTSGASAAAAQR
jgi:murein DD-endopeptidase MepM/ murein hydrolase activator NlpD